MTYFDCFMLGAWTFAIGWLLGAIYVQNRKEKTASPRAVKELEPCTECDEWRLPVAASAGAD